MIKHIIFWRFRPEIRNGDAQQRRQMIQQMNQSAKNMVGKIDGLICAEVAENTAPNGCDFVYYAEFSSKQALEAYQMHPLHKQHQQMSADWLESREVCDYEI